MPLRKHSPGVCTQVEFVNNERAGWCGKPAARTFAREPMCEAHYQEALCCCGGQEPAVEYGDLYSDPEFGPVGQKEE